MNTGPFVNDWLRLLAVLGIELGALTAVFALLQRATAYPRARRLSWRAALVGTIFVVGFELAGVSQWMAARWPADSAATRRVTIVSSNLDPAPQFRLQPAGFSETTAGYDLRPTIPPSHIAPPKSVWWPAWLWLAGMILLFGRMVAARVVFAIGLRRHRRFCDPQIARRVLELAKLLGLSRRIRVFQLDELPAPISYGAFRAGIVLPAHFIRDNDEASRNAMLLHELAHVASRDALWHALGDLVVGCFWWHPAVWWMRREMESASELAADEASAAIENGPRVLAECLVRMARRLTAPAGAGWQGIQGNRFRSPVGRRVDRLLELGPASSANRAARRWVERAVVMLLLAGMVVIGGLVSHRQAGDSLSWRTSWNASFGGLFLSQLAAAEPELSSRAPETAPVDPIEWSPWSAAAVAEARSHGRTVLVHFTADWALDAAANEKIALDVREVRERLRSLNAASLKADWTTPTNAAIEAELNRYGKVSVPLTLVYGPDVTMPPEVLPNALTPEMVLAALERSTATRVNSTTTTKTASPATVSVPQVSTVLFEAKALYDAGKLAEAKAKLTAVLKDDPRNEAARHYLALIDKAQSAPKTVTPSVNDNARFISGSGVIFTNLQPPFPPPGPQRQISDQLDSIRIASFGGIMPLSATVLKLVRESRSADPNGQGINVMIEDFTQGGSLYRSNDFTRSERIEPLLIWRDLKSVNIRIHPPLHDVTLRQLLEAIVKVASEPIQYAVHDYEVVISFRTRPSLESLQVGPSKVSMNVTVRTNSVPASDALITPASKKLVEAEALYHAGLLTEAAEKFEAILKEDPKSEAARHYLSMIQKARSSLPATSKRALLYERLDALRLDTFGGTLPLSAIVEKLGREIRAAVPSGGGMNFLITEKKQESDDLSSIVVQLEPPLRGATVRQILDAMVKGTGELIRYSVEDYAVVFTRAVPSLVQPAPALHTRWFKIDSKTFLRSIQGFDSGAEARRSGGDGGVQSAFGGAGHVTVVTSLDQIIIAARQFFTSAGVDFTSPGKQLFFNDRLGMLMVRATLEDLDVIEQAIQVIHTPPPQVVIEARFCEIPAEELSRLGFDWMLGNTLAESRSTPATSNGSNDIDFGLPMPATNSPSAVKGILTARQAEVVLRALSQRSGVDILATPKVTTLSGRQAQIKVVDIRSVVTHLAPPDSTNGNAAMPRRRGGGRGDGGEFELVPVTELFESGPVLDVVPYVRADGVTIELTLIATVKEFMGYDLETPPTRIDNSPVRSPNPAYQGVTLPPIIGPDLSRDRSRVGSGQPVAQVEPKPVYRLRQMVAPVRVWDGQTVVLSGGVDKLDLVRSKSAPVLGDLPLLGRLFRTEHAEKQQKKLVVLVTVTIIDPAGNRVHEPGDIPAGVPVQPERLK